jgi:phage protein D
MTTDRSAPGVRFTSIPDPKAASGAPVDLRGRVVSFTFEESDERADKLQLELDNRDGALFERAELLGGALLEVTWGYPGNMAPPRRAVVAKLRGFTTLTVEAHGLAALWNDAARTHRWENVTRSDVARAIAASHGYEGSFANIDDTEERFDVVNQVGETDAWLLRRLAAKEHFLFVVDAEGFHFHARRQTDAPEHVLVYVADPARGDVLSVNVESDLTRRVGAVTVRGRDPMNKTTVEGKATADTARRGTLGDVLEVFDRETGAGSTRPWNATASVQATPANTSAQAAREADARFAHAESATVLLAVQTAGNPSLRARSIVEMQGLPPRLAGKYRLRAVKHTIQGGGYTCDLKLSRDAVGSVPAAMPAKPQGGEHNTGTAKDDGALEWVEAFDKETGAGRIEFRRGNQRLGAGDPEGKR